MTCFGPACHSVDLHDEEAPLRQDAIASKLLFGQGHGVADPEIPVEHEGCSLAVGREHFVAPRGRAGDRGARAIGGVGCGGAARSTA